MNKLSDIELGIVIGLIEGEGTITVNYNKSGNSYDINVAISNTNKERLNWIKRKLNIGIVRLTCEKREKWSANYEFELHKIEIKKFLELILPYLIIKKYQCLATLEYLKETTNYSKIKTFHGHENIISPKEWGLRQNIVEASTHLNKRGPYTEEELIELQKVKNYYDWWFEENYPVQCKINKEFNK